MDIVTPRPKGIRYNVTYNKKERQAKLYATITFAENVPLGGILTEHNTPEKKAEVRELLRQAIITYITNELPPIIEDDISLN